MRIAIIGAGFAGLAVAYFLLKTANVEVVVFDAKKIGGGASGVCSGLAHPYPGLSARRSFQAQEALTILRELLSVAEAHTSKTVAIYEGILRKALDEKQAEQFSKYRELWKDLHHMQEDLFLINSGMTIACEQYLEGLWNALESQGALLQIRKIEALQELEEFDQYVIAAGYGVSLFPECAHLPLKYLKGQILRLKGAAPFDRSFISRGYIAYLNGNEFFEVGSTYEKNFRDDLPDQDIAVSLLQDKLQTYCQGAKIFECRAAIRVTSIHHYLPIIEPIGEKGYVFTALGSRGLLYHGLYGEKLAKQILSKNRSLA